MTGEEAEVDWDSPTGAHHASVKAVYASLIKPPVLELLVPGSPHMIDRDARSYVIGSFPLQKQKQGEADRLRHYRIREQNSKKGRKKNFSEVEGMLCSRVARPRPPPLYQNFQTVSTHRTSCVLVDVDDQLPPGIIDAMVYPTYGRESLVMYRPSSQHQEPDTMFQFLQPLKSKEAEDTFDGDITKYTGTVRALTRSDVHEHRKLVPAVNTNSGIPTPHTNA